MGLTDGERMLRRSGEPEQLGLVQGRLGESAKFGEAVDHPETNVNRYRYGAASERLIDPIGGQRRKAIRGELDRLLEVTAELMRLRKIDRGPYAEPQVPKARGNLQRARAG